MSRLAPDLDRQQLANRAQRMERVLAVLQGRRRAGPVPPPALDQTIDDLTDQLISVRHRLREDAARGAHR